MRIEDIIADRGITELLHFTTNKGLLGILASGRILSRERLPKEKYLEHVYNPNAVIRRDQDWLDYVNLSISRINEVFFRTAHEWHRNEGVWWCAIGLDPALLLDPGVVFATTNNIYSGVQRAEGSPGLNALFAESISQWPGRTVIRTPGQSCHFTTCVQAEVLYPAEISRKYFKSIYVPSEERGDFVGAQASVLDNVGLPSLSIVVADEMLNE